jgi:hypothetical protein
LLILNRYLFDLPESLERESRHFQHFLSGWGGLPVTLEAGHPRRHSDRIFLRWPWEVGHDGVWHLTGEFSGYLGPPYSPFREFDYAAAHFGKRGFVEEERRANR